MKFKFYILVLFIAVLPSLLFAGTIQIKSPTGVSVRLDEDSGAYKISYQPAKWMFAGQTQQSFVNATTNRGSDSVGSYTEISWANGASLTDSIRLYDTLPVVLLTMASSEALEKWPADFPDFTSFPTLHHFSFKDTNFARPRFDLETNGAPWVLFDDSANAALISPADHLLIASMTGDGVHEIASGLNSQVRDLPANFSHGTLIAFGNGIHTTWKTWSDAFLALQGVKRPNNEADLGLRYLGYWTDNGATYYYNYDTNSGYADTLENLVSRYRDEGIPIRYLQLDSWWYEKTLTGLDGKRGKTKNPRLPKGDWNCYGGLLEYHADPAVLPDGLGGFKNKIDMPLITHNRWIDPASPYHEKYQISGVAGVDPKYWDEIMSYIASNGVTCYEQDWINEIYAHSPELQSTPGLADAFADNMARAAQDNNLSLQYCMALPRFFLQGSHYPNLTTIRTSDDHFIRARWDDFLYVSQLARAVGIWPWADVFMSTEQNNLLISVLSAGMVGVGDPIGQESKQNLLRAARPDGVLVKPDESLLPLDDVYVAQANGKKNPMVAWTYSDHGPLRTAYVFAYVREKANSEASFKPSVFGLNGKVVVLNVRSGAASFQSARKNVPVAFDTDGTAYYEVAPVGKSDIAFFGDEEKYVSNGQQRIAGLVDADDKLTATITLAAGEKSVTVFGYAKEKPRASASMGSVGDLNYDKNTGRFSVEVMPAAYVTNSGGDPVQTAVVTFTTS
ncbi:MAG TPA: hypothetical protein VNU95_02885 [Candidatus Acidoferrales bacterium]|jgi:hypothetical protein|nr:hypothetical protein [Candidatus Acidoferrales bacterium]